MFHPLSKIRGSGWVAPKIVWIVFLALPISPAHAHTVKASGDVAATFHIEPHHTPQAGEPAQAWFALTHKGGSMIPLKECNCHLAVYSESHIAGSPPLLEPALKAISTDQYQGIPGSDIVFPKSGIYELELSGTPKTGESFTPFKLTYEVIVGAGTPKSTAATPQTETHVSEHSEHQHNSESHEVAQERSPSTHQWQTPILVIGTLVGLGVLGLIWRRSK